MLENHQADTLVAPAGTDSGDPLNSEISALRAALSQGMVKLVRLPSGAARAIDLLNEMLGQVGNAAAGGERVSAEEILARKAGAWRRGELLVEHGGTCSAEQAARRLGLSKPAVLERAENGRLLGLRVLKQNAVRFPVFQFAANDETLIPGLDEVLDVLRAEPSLDAWAKCNFLLSPRDSLKGEAPLSLLRRGQVKKVVALARAYAN